MEIYVVAPKDNVDQIALLHGIPVERLIYDNQLVYPYDLAVGQALLIQDGENAPRTRKVQSGGYAYPFISLWVLRETLPYLTELLVFSYGFTAGGDLVPPILDDIWMVETALAYGTRPILTLTPLGEDGMFSNYLISAVVRNQGTRERLIANLLQMMEEKKYEGLDIDFEYILPEDRDYFTDFVAACARALHRQGYTLSVALAPKTSANQAGLLYEGKDYPALGAIADSVLLMTYEWGYTYGPPMGVAPINKVRQVVEYAVTEIPREKINLGIPNYGYDWPLPFVQGITKARTIGNVEAVRIAIENGAAIQFDQVSQSPFFHYRNREGTSHEVWFEDVRSLNAKYTLMEEFGLRGIGVWQIMRFFRASWLLLEERFY